MTILSKLDSDIKAITTNKDKIKKLVLTAEIHTPSDVYTHLEVAALSVYRDYLNGIGDYLLSTIKLLPSQYRNILKDIHNIECSITYSVLSNTNEKISKEVIRYKAIYHNPDKSDVVANGGMNVGGLNQDLSGHEFIHFQLMDLSTEALRHGKVSGAYHNITTEEAILTLLGTLSSNIKTRGQKSISVINIVPPDNKQPYKDLVIPTGTHGHGVIGLLQNKFKGIYSKDAGCYIQRYKEKPTWFVYPLYDKELYTSKLPRLIIFKPIVPIYDEAEKTYLIKGNDISIIVENQVDMKRDTGTKTLDTGNGFEYIDANETWGTYHQNTPSGPIVGNTYRAVTNGSRPDGNNNTRAKANTDKPITANPYTESSRVLNREVNVLTCIWNNSVDLLYPGMPVLYKTEEKGKIITYQGQVVQTQLNYARVDTHILKNAVARTAIQIAVYRKE